MYADQIDIENMKFKICFYINKRIDQFRIKIHFESRDILIIKIQLKSSKPNLIHSLWLHNVYNESNTISTLALIKLRKILKNRRVSNANIDNFNENIIVENLNIHHSQWEDFEIRFNSRSHELLNIIDEFKLTQHVSQKTRTYISNTYDTPQTLNLCFIFSGLINRVIHCKVRKNVEQNSDHYPISTKLDLNVIEVFKKGPLCWNKMNLNELKEAFEIKFKKLSLNLNSNRLADKNEIDKTIKGIITAIDHAVKTAVSRITIIRQSKSKWTDECKQTCAEIQRRRRLYQQILNISTPPHLKKTIKQRWQKVDHKKKKLIAKILRNIHKKKIKEFNDNMNKVWKLIKWVKNRGNSYKAYTPTLTNAQKSKIIKKSQKIALLVEFFFSKSSDANLSNIDNYQYLDPIRFEELKNHELMNAIKNVLKEKASDDDEINNKTLIALLSKLIPILKKMFQACLKTKHCSSHFRRSVTMILKKFKKKSYNILKIYRFITLLNTINKTLKSILINRLTWAAKTYELLSNLHFDERKNISSKMTIHILIEKIHIRWKEKLTDSLLLLNVSKIFDNVFHQRLLHNLRKRKIDDAMLKWIKSFITNKQIKLRLSNFTSNWININTEISQNSSLSPILYLFYNADLLNIFNDENLNSLTINYIDDITILMTEISPEKNIKKLKALHNQILNWSKKHASIFDLKKYQLMHFQNRNSRDRSSDVNCDLKLPKVIVKAKKNCKYLKITIDSQLKWNSHMNQMKTKATKRLTALQTLSKSTWRINLKNMRKIYQKTILPLFLYCASAWYILTEK